MNTIKKKKFRKVLFVVMTLALVMAIGTVFCTAQEVDSTGGFGSALDQFISILVGGLESLGAGIGTGVNDYVSNLFLELDSSGNIVGLSTFGGVAAIFGS